MYSTVWQVHECVAFIILLFVTGQSSNLASKRRQRARSKAGSKAMPLQLRQVRNKIAEQVRNAPFMAIQHPGCFEAYQWHVRGHALGVSKNIHFRCYLGGCVLHTAADCR